MVCLAWFSGALPELSCGVKNNRFCSPLLLRQGFVFWVGTARRHALFDSKFFTGTFLFISNISLYLLFASLVFYLCPFAISHLINFIFAVLFFRDFACKAVQLFSLLFLLTLYLPATLLAEEVLPASVPESKEPEGGWGALFNEHSSALWRPLIEINERAKLRASRPVVAEAFTGSDVTENQFGFYAGGVTGALGPHLNLDGLKLRAVYGRSFYQYRSKLEIAAGKIDALFIGESRFYEAMIGYEFRFQDIIFKAYGGMVHELNHIDPNDAENKLQGDLTGAKALLEVWREFDGGHWFSGYGAYTTSTEYYTIHGRLGTPLSSFMDVGLEAGSFGNQQYDALRLGAFGKLKLGDGEITVSGGVSGDYDQPDSVYGSIQYFTKLYTPIEWGWDKDADSEDEDEGTNKSLWDFLSRR